MMAHHSD